MADRKSIWWERPNLSLIVPTIQTHSLEMIHMAYISLFKGCHIFGLSQQVSTIHVLMRCDSLELSLKMFSKCKHHHFGKLWKTFEICINIQNKTKFADNH